MQTKKHTLTLFAENQAREIHFEGTKTLHSILKEEDIFLFQPCGGAGICGKCKVAAFGALSPYSKEEVRLLSGLDSSVRLGCRLELLGDATVTIPTQEEQLNITTHSELSTLPAYDGEDFPAYGIAVDIGTTTIVSYLYHLNTAKHLNAASELNMQTQFGSDIISRIEYSNQNGTAPLVDSLRKQLKKLFLENLTKAGITAKNLTRMVITGNTTMLHYLTGKDPQSIGVSPFIPESLFGYAQPASDLFGGEYSEATLYIPPCISAHTGADIVSGLFPTILEELVGEADGNFLLVDVGTNGEMVLYTDGSLSSCATAAGPAFEGHNIQNGMPASAGAIARVYEENGILLYETIQNKPPKGLCGTGILSMMTILLDCGLLDDTGRLEKNDHHFSTLLFEHNGQPAFMIGDSEVFLTQADVRNIQLAKAAIAAGIEALLHKFSLAPSSIGKTFLAGGFGNHLDPADALRIGLLPKLPLDGILSAGNTAGQGAVYFLLSLDARALAEKIAGSTKDIALSTNAYFMDRYTENMFFPEA